ncbi:hypothetical protein [Candidatus Methylocalor cossyra]|uniref:Uncharacterized protein n=1 Tax=Candidatus Methylocalor cossyra TaxID=3108543 RepID=A0ABM9NM26_9GAMM
MRLTTALAASLFLSSTGPSVADQGCRPFGARDATINLAPDPAACIQKVSGISEFQSFFSNAIPFSTFPVCYLSDDGIDGIVNGEPVQIRSLSVFLQPVVASAQAQAVATVYSVSDRRSGAPRGELYAIDIIHPQEGYENEMFIGGADAFHNTGGWAEWQFTVPSSARFTVITAGSQLPPPSIHISRLRGKVCVPGA